VLLNFALGGKLELISFNLIQQSFLFVFVSVRTDAQFTDMREKAFTHLELTSDHLTVDQTVGEAMQSSRSKVIITPERVESLLSARLAFLRWNHQSVANTAFRSQEPFTRMRFELLAQMVHVNPQVLRLLFGVGSPDLAQ
jgi:hypothetical protein